MLDKYRLRLQFFPDFKFAIDCKIGKAERFTLPIKQSHLIQLGLVNKVSLQLHAVETKSISLEL